MRKIYSFMVAAVALFSAASCNKEFTNDQENLPVGETVVYTASVEGADSKATLNETTKKSEWVTNDAITVIDETGKNWDFTTASAGQNVEFSNSEGFGEYRPVLAVYPKGTYTASVSEKTLTASIPTFQGAKENTYNENAALAVAYSEGSDFAFKNAHALLKFTVKGEKSIKAIEFYGNNGEAITGNMLVSLNEDGTIKTVEGQDTEITENEVTETKKGTWVKFYSEDEANGWCFKENVTYYVAIAPANFTQGFAINLILADDSKIKGYKKYEGALDLKASQILPLGEIEYDPNKVDASAYGLVGSFQGWDVANPTAMKYVSDGWIVAENVELYKDSEFKFAKDKSWDGSYGTSAVTVLEEGKEIAVVTSSSQNMKVAKNGKYNLYLNPNAKKVKVECVEEYTDLMVNITIDNKADWSPLTITLWNGNEEIYSNATVTNNKYAISGDYIGSSLTCQLFSGSKQSEKMNVTITKDGATVTLEETVIKLKVQLNTANAKQWWGNTMKIHVWDTGTSLDTSWPGTAMTSEGNYTWSIIVPSELVGKTIKYLVHNGNGWQSSDATVTISASGNTVTGSSIGIN